MTQFDSKTYTAFSQALAFCGNSLLDTMNHTGDAGLQPGFWEAFPTFGDAGVREAVDGMKAYAEGASSAGGDPATDASVEFTRLFVGPPKPATAPWETYYRAAPGQEVKVGFGEATFQMQGLLREAGLQVNNENNQFADHMGIELLLASVYSKRAAEGDEEAAEKLHSFVAEHPGTWVGKFRAVVEETEPGRYFSHLLALAEALLALA